MDCRHHFLINLQADSQAIALWCAAFRLFFLVALAIYIGGFTFYSAVVIPVLHDRLESSLETGMVTQRVTDALNWLGVVTLSSGWCVYGLSVARGFRSGRGGPPRVWTLLLSSACLVVLFVLHQVLDRKIEMDTFTGFYAYHRAYLWISTLQWFANLGLLIQSAGFFTQAPGSHP
jgi:hypothetical protein